MFLKSHNIFKRGLSLLGCVQKIGSKLYKTILKLVFSQSIQKEGIWTLRVIPSLEVPIPRASHIWGSPYQEVPIQGGPQTGGPKRLTMKKQDIQGILKQYRFEQYDPQFAQNCKNWKSMSFCRNCLQFLSEYDSKYSWNPSFKGKIDRKVHLGLKIFDPVNCRRLDSNLQFLQSSQNCTKLKSMNFCRYCLQFLCD